MAAAARKSRAFAAAFAAVMLLAAGLRIYFVAHESLSGDEIYQRLVILRPYLDELPALRGDIVHPPLSYWLARAVSSVAGFGVFGLRLPALVFGLLTVALTMVLGLRLSGDRRIALAAGLLVALSDLQSTVSHFARGYAMLAALVLAYLLVLEKILRSDGRTRLWAALAALTVALAYTHYLSWLFVLAALPAVVLRGRGRARLLWLGISAAAALAFLPWVLAVLPSLRRAGGLSVVVDWIKPPGLGALPALFARFSGPAELPLAAASLAAAIAVLALGARASRRRSGFSSGSAGRAFAARPLLWGVAILPPVLLFLLAVPPVGLPIWGIRHLVPSQAPWAVLLGIGAVLLAGKSRAKLAICLSVLALLQALPTVDAALHYKFDPFGPAARALADRGEPRPGLPLYAFETRERQIMSFYLGSEDFVLLLPEGDAELPARFWLLYHPAGASDAGRLRRLRTGGYAIEARLDFIKRPGDPRGLRLVLLRRRAKVPQGVA